MEVKRENIVVYGLGEFWHQHREELEKEYDIVQYCDKTAEIEGLSICRSIDNIKKNLKIFIMISQIHILFEVINELAMAGVISHNINFGISRWGGYSKLERIYVDDDYRMHIVCKNIDLIINSEDEFYNAIDTILLECYKYHINSDKPEVVFDVGMNIGDSTIFFSKNPKVKMVYGFEPFKKTYNSAIKNIELNNIGNNVKVFNFGLSGSELTKHLNYGDNMSCGQSTINSINEENICQYEKWGLIKKDELVSEDVILKRSSVVLAELMDKNPVSNYILKLDCEGEEYSIFEDISESEIINKFSLILLEWHYRGAERLIDLLEKNGFSFVSCEKELSPALGLIYAWK